MQPERYIGHMTELKISHPIRGQQGQAASQPGIQHTTKRNGGPGPLRADWPPYLSQGHVTYIPLWGGI